MIILTSYVGRGRTRQLLTPLSFFLAASLAVTVGLAGCDKADKTERPAGPPEATVSSPQPLPAMPDWSKVMIEKPVVSIFHNTAKACRGAFDIVKVRYSATPAGVQAAGWAWDDDAKAAPLHVIFLDDADLIVGAAETSMNRPDVQKAMTDVTTPKVGWLGLIDQTRGNVRAMAVLKDGSICQVGTKFL